MTDITDNIHYQECHNLNFFCIVENVTVGERRGRGSIEISNIFHNNR